MASCSGSSGVQPTETSPSLFGWDLLYKTIANTVHRKSDIVIAFVHFVLIKRCNFRCVGIGEDKTLAPQDVGSELLPDDWNAEGGNKYALRYKHNQQLYLLLAHHTGDCLIVNLLDVATRQVSNVTLAAEELVCRTQGGVLREMIPRHTELGERVQRELIDPVCSATTREMTTQTRARVESTSTSIDAIGSQSEHNRPDLLRRPSRRLMPTPPPTPPIYPHSPLRIIHPPPPPPAFRPWPGGSVGFGDLDPLGRGGPGNLVPPPEGPNLRNEARPRFDPYGAPVGNQPPDPDPDHLQPPSMGGNYFS